MKRPSIAIRGASLLSATPLSASPRRAVRAAASVGDVARYISDAAAQIFYPPDDSDVPWERAAGSAFTGPIVHHDAARLRQLRDAVRAARAQLEGSASPAGATTADTDQPAAAGDAGDFVVSSIRAVFDANVKGGPSEPARYFSGGYRSRARSQRELRREIGRLERFERVLERTIQNEGGRAE